MPLDPRPLDPLCDLQKGLIAHLKDHAPLQTWLGAQVRIHDAVPPEPVYPYVLVDRVEAQPFGGVGVAATEQALTLRVVSDFDGTEEARAIASELRVALDQAQVPLDSHHLVSLRVTYLDVFRGADRTVFALLRLRAVTEPI